MGVGTIERARARLSTVAPLDLLVIAVVVLLPLARMGTDFGHASIRGALLLAVAPVGIAGLVHQVARRDPAAIGMAGFGAAALLAAVAARHRLPALLGDVDSRSSAILVVAFVAAWGLGRLYRGGTRLLEGTVLVTSAVGMAAVVSDAVLRDQVRPPGLAGNSVFAGSLGAAGIAVVAGWAARAASPGALAACAADASALGLGVGLTGSRAAAAAAVVGVLLACWGRWARVALVSAAVVAGLLFAATMSDESAATRSAVDAGGGLSVRSQMWGLGLDAWTERPVLGWGPGRFREATGPHVTLQVALAERENATYDDAHDLGIEALTTTGVVGAALLALGVGGSLVAGRGTVRVVAVVLLLCHMLAPLSLVVTPLLFLALGAARPPGPPPLWSRAARVAVGAATVIGMLAGLAWFTADVSLTRAGDQQGPGVDLDRARAVAPGWLTPALYEATAEFVRARESGLPADRRRAEAAGDLAVDRDPASVDAILVRAAMEQEWGDPDRVVDRLLAAAELAPWNTQVLFALRDAGIAADRPDVVRRAEERLCRLRPDAPAC